MDLFALLISWETIVMAVFASALTQLTKLVIEIQLAEVKPDLRTAKRSGADARKLRPVITQVLLPLLPLLFGALFGVLTWRAALLHGIDDARSCVSWGVLSGLIGEYVYSRVHGLRRAVRDNRAG
jgi:hypothetical protein